MSEFNLRNNLKRAAVGAGITGALFGPNVAKSFAASAEKPATEAALQAQVEQQLYAGDDVPTLQGSFAVVDRGGKSLTSVSSPLVVARTEAGKEMVDSGKVNFADTQDIAVGYITRDERPKAVLFTEKDRKAHRFVFNVKRGPNGAFVPAIMNVHFALKGNVPDLGSPLNDANMPILNESVGGPQQNIARQVATSGRLNLDPVKR